MGKKGKKAQAGKPKQGTGTWPKKPTPKDVSKRMDVLAKKLEEELKGADLFAPLPPTDDCAICFIRLSRANQKSFYQACCGKIICEGCYGETEEFVKKQNAQNAGKKNKKPIFFTCPFCRAPELTPNDSEEDVRRLETRALQKDPVALRSLAGMYALGVEGVRMDALKALDCWIRAIECGCASSCNDIARLYEEGYGIFSDKKRAGLFERVGAMRGDVFARHNIGLTEYKLGNHEIAIRHWKISAEAGYQPSLDALKKIYNADGKQPGKKFISKEYLELTYRACHEAQMEVKTEEREKLMTELQNVR